MNCSSRRESAQIGADSRSLLQQLQFPHQTFCAANPDAVALALERRRVNVVAQNVLEFDAGEVGLVLGGVKFGELDLGAGGSKGRRRR